MNEATMMREVAWNKRYAMQGKNGQGEVILVSEMLRNEWMKQVEWVKLVSDMLCNEWMTQSRLSEASEWHAV